jgi:hypothetical protein
MGGCVVGKVYAHVALMSYRCEWFRRSIVQMQQYLHVHVDNESVTSQISAWISCTRHSFPSARGALEE